MGELVFDAEVNNQSVKINYCSDLARAIGFNDSAIRTPGAAKVIHEEWLGGYRYPILDWISEQLGGSHYQILKIPRPSNGEEHDVLRDSNTLYAYPTAKDITVVQFDKWDKSVNTLADLGIDIVLSQKLFKRIRTFNRVFRAFHRTTDTVKVWLVGDDEFSRHFGEFDPDIVERLFDGAFIIAPAIVDACMAQFDLGTTVFNEDVVFSTNTFNRNTEVGDYYKKSKVFNARIFGPMEIINEGEYGTFGAIKGQAFTDLGGLCEHWGVDVIAPRSAFKPEINISTASFYLIEPQNAKLGQMFSDGQTIVNLPALYNWEDVDMTLGDWFDDTYNHLTNNKILTQWSEMSFTSFDPDHPKMFDNSDVNAITAWNVRAWLTCGGKLSDSPWLFERMAKNLHDAMHTDDPGRLRFPVQAAARAQVIPEALLRGIKGVWDADDESHAVPFGSAHWDTDLNVLVVNDHNWVEMYASHGGCDEDDFFQIYWRTINGKKKVIVVRSPNDWGEYSVFDYIEGDWSSKTTLLDKTTTFPEVTADPDMWPKRLSEAVADGDVTYSGLPETEIRCDIQRYNVKYVEEAIEDTAASGRSVGVNVNARQLWSDSMKCHRPLQICSLEDCIDAGVQGGTDAEVQAVIDEGAAIIDYLLKNKVPIDQYLWESKHMFFYKDAEVVTYTGNPSYLQSVRFTRSKEFLEKTKDYAEKITSNANYDWIHALGAQYLPIGINLLRQSRLNTARSNRGGNIDPGMWESLSDIVIGTIESYPEGHERSSLLLALYSACLKIPTSAGKITDQLVMQPMVFRHLLEALQFYGVLCYLEVSEDGKLKRHRMTEWHVFDEPANKMQHFDNPLKYQAWYFEKKAIEQVAE